MKKEHVIATKENITQTQHDNIKEDLRAIDHEFKRMSSVSSSIFYSVKMSSEDAAIIKLKYGNLIYMI